MIAPVEFSIPLSNNSPHLYHYLPIMIIPPRQLLRRARSKNDAHRPHLRYQQDEPEGEEDLQAVEVRSAPQGRLRQVHQAHDEHGQVHHALHHLRIPQHQNHHRAHPQEGIRPRRRVRRQAVQDRKIC